VSRLLRPVRLRRLAAVPVAAVVAAALSLSGCGGRGAGLGTTSSACFHALPPAVASLHHPGHLIGVRLVDTGRLRDPALRAVLAPRRKLCLVAFSGSFAPADVERPIDQRNGNFVMVAVRPDGSAVLASLIVTRLPLGFRHSHSL
jgi:hypothetical protein